MRVAKLTTLAIVFAFTGGCESGPAAPVAGPGPVSLERVKLNERIPIAGTASGTCPGAEPIAYEGFAHINQHGDVEPGSEDVKTRVNIHASGVGLITGNRYQLIENDKEEIVFDDATPFLDQQFSYKTRFISQGSGDNFFVTGRFHLVCDETGCRFLQDEFEIECRG